MSEKDLPPIGSEPPLIPTHSLPSYGEPTPETHRKVSRETEAELALKNTLFTPGTAIFLTLAFLVAICAVPLIQFAHELRTASSIQSLPTFTAFGSMIPRHHVIRSIADIWHALPKADDTKLIQKTLERESVVAQWLLPHVDSVLTGTLGAGNEQVYLGRNNWLFYRADVDYVIGPPFLDPFWIKRRTLSAGVQPDAVRAIVDFRNQLAGRGIDLIVMPAPVKPTIDGEMLAPDAGGVFFENESFGQFKARLKAERVRVLDPKPWLITNGRSSRSYLRADTHWRPEAMETVAEYLAYLIGVSRGESSFEVVDRKIKAIGDIAQMLKVPAEQLGRYAEEITIHEVIAGNAAWRPNKNADVLLLGDSFSNIFSLEALGWGESAGFAEHLSRVLGRPIDCILRNSDGAFATREILSRELSRGRDRLAGKKIVVWEFASRELASGNWKPLDMTLRQAPPARFFVPQTGERINVTGTVESTSTVPFPGSAPYSDHIMAVHLVDVTGTGSSDHESVECLVYLWSMRDNIWTRAARLRPGDRIALQLQPWSDVSGQLEKFNRSEMEDPSIQLEEPCWGEFSR